MLQSKSALRTALAGHSVAIGLRTIWTIAGALAALLVFGAASGVQWPFFLASGALLFVAFGQFMGWAMALATEIIGVFAVLALLISLYPFARLGLEWSNLVVCGILAAAALAAIARRRHHLRLPVLSSVYLMGGALIVPVLGVLATVFSIVAYGGGHVSWAMGNDAVWNTVAARLFVTDGGLIASIHPNPSPFSNELMASAMAPGRAAVANLHLLEHDILRVIQLWLFLTFLACILSALVVAREISPRRRWARVFACILAGSIPLLWYVSGFAFGYGFVNVTVALVVMLCVWIIWKESAASPFIALCALMLACTVTLAVWAPLVPIPLALAALGAAMQWRAWRAALRWPTGLLFWGAALQLAGYGLLVTFPDLRRDSEALGGGGAMVPIGPASMVICSIVLFVLAAAGAAGRGRRRTFAAVCVLIAAGGASVYWLSRQAAAHGGWGYYSAKLTWILTIVAIIIAVSLIVGWLNAPASRLVESAAIFAAAGAVVVLLAGQVPPASWSPGQMVPALTIGRVGGSSAHDAEAAVLFALSDPTKKTLAVQYFDDPDQDLFVDAWLIQQHSDVSRDPMRDNAYFLDTSKLDRVCSTIRQWGGHVDIATRNPALQKELGEQCAGADFSVTVGSVGAS